MTDREWCWTAAIVTIGAMAFSPSGWLGIIALMLVWTLLSGE